MTANLRGVDSHGVVRLRPYAKSVAQGGFNSSPDITVDRVAPSSVLVDADDGPGQVGTIKAIEATIDAAEENGVGFGSIRNSNHFGTAAYYTQRAAQEDYIGFAMTNAGPNVAPFGGIDPFFGTNPFAYSIPTNRDFSITLDMATSLVSKGKIHVAEEENESIPERWAVDEQGTSTTDPESVHALRPVGGPKGYGLGLLIDICSGVLSGMGISPEVDSLYDDYGEPQQIGHFVGVVDPSYFRDIELFKREIDVLIDRLKEVRTEDGVDEVMLPGEIEAVTRREREKKGIPLGPGVVATLIELEDQFGAELSALIEET